MPNDGRTDDGPGVVEFAIETPAHEVRGGGGKKEGKEEEAESLVCSRLHYSRLAALRWRDDGGGSN